MQFGHLHLLPWGLCALFFITFVTTYVISVLSKDVEPIFPYISDTGTFTPTSCIFGQLLNVGAIILAIIVYIKYRQVRIINEEFSHGISGLNTTCLFLGWLASLGIGIVANFQETNVFAVHLIGAIMAFGFLAIYQILIWYINRKLIKQLNISTLKLNVQIFYGILSSITFISCFGFAMLALNDFTGKDMTKWKPEDGGYDLHLVSTITEWICGISSILFVLTFVGEFRKLSISEPLVSFVE